VSDCLEATLAMIAAKPVDRSRPVSRPAGLFPAPLRDYVGGDLDSVKWKKLGGGVSQYLLDTSRDATVRLLHIPAGKAVPDHGHRGTELTLVLQGAFLDGSDRFARGDIEIADESLEHTPDRGPGRGLHLPCGDRRAPALQQAHPAHRAALHRHLMTRACAR
jgi:putative transcriptional regulator